MRIKIYFEMLQKNFVPLNTHHCEENVCQFDTVLSFASEYEVTTKAEICKLHLLRMV